MLAMEGPRDKVWKAKLINWQALGAWLCLTRWKMHSVSAILCFKRKKSDLNGYLQEWQNILHQGVEFLSIILYFVQDFFLKLADVDTDPK